MSPNTTVNLNKLFAISLSMALSLGPIALSASGATTSNLSLPDFLRQVSEKHDGFRAASQAAKAGDDESIEGSLIFRPQVTASASLISDKQSNPLAADDQFRLRAYNAGVSQQTGTGLSGKLSFNRTEILIPNLAAYTPTWLSLDLSQSLLRNGMGRETRAQSEAITNGSLARARSQGFVARQIMLEAESNYWRLVLARERVQMMNDAVVRGERLQSWVRRRVDLHLADRADLLQSSSNLQSQRLELKRAKDDESAAAQTFNSARGINANSVSENLTDLTPSLIKSIAIPARELVREDVQAAEFQAKASSASAAQASERNTPNLEVFASVPLTEPSTAGASATTTALLPLNSRPATTIGVRFSAPLDFITLNQVRQGYNAEASAANNNYSRKSFEADRDWKDLSTKFTQAKERLDLVTELEKSQKTKLDYERDRHEHGRSTTQQVLYFENDYEQAQLARLQSFAEILTLNAQMKLYGAAYESR